MPPRRRVYAVTNGRIGGSGRLGPLNCRPDLKISALISKRVRAGSLAAHMHLAAISPSHEADSSPQRCSHRSPSRRVGCETFLVGHNRFDRPVVAGPLERDRPRVRVTTSRQASQVRTSQWPDCLQM